MQTPPRNSSEATRGVNEKIPNKSKDSKLIAHKRRAEVEELDAAIGRLNCAINASNYELMVLIREFDERAGWLQWGFTDGLNWLKWRCDLSTGAARDKLRIAHALKELPLLSESFSAGKLSYTKVRAVTRIATAENEAELITMATRMSARHVEEHCKQRSNARKASTAVAQKAQQNKAYRLWHDEAKGTVHFSVELPREEAELIEKAVEKASVQLSMDTGSAAMMPEETVSWATQQADALVSLCRTFLCDSIGSGDSADTDSEDTCDKPPEASSARSSSSTADHYQVVVHVDESALAGEESGKSQLPVESVRRLCCDGSVIPVIENESGEPLNVGRKVRTVTTAIRRALWSRDKGCGFPGCSHKRFVDAHHIKHWADGGETSVENMVLLCSTHHKLVHEGGYSVQRDHSGELFFRRPDGKAVPHCGFHVGDHVDLGEPETDQEVAEYLKNSCEFSGVRESAGFYAIYDLEELNEPQRIAAA